MRSNASQICSITDENEYEDTPLLNISVCLSHVGDGPVKTVSVPLTGDKGIIRIRTRVIVDDILDEYMETNGEECLELCGDDSE